MARPIAKRQPATPVQEVTTAMCMKTVTKKLSLMALVIAAWVAFAAPAAAEQSLDTELEQYWATERELAVIEDRLFERDGMFGVGLFAGLLTSEPFFHYYPLGGRLSYHFSNHLGVELGGSYMISSYTELTEFMEGELQDAFDSSQHTQDRFLWRANAMAMFSPFYGKIAALQQKLMHFDLNFGAGLGVVGVERPQWNLDRPQPEGLGAEDKIAPEFILGVGAHFYINQDFVLRLDGRGYLYQGAELPSNTDSTFGRLSFPVEFNLGVNYLF